MHNVTVTVSPALRRLLLECQTWCSADCCKAQAFSLRDGVIAGWLGSERVDRSAELADEIDRVGTNVREADDRVILAVRGLESGWSAVEFKAFWASFRAAYSSAVEGRVEAEPSVAADPALSPCYVGYSH